jgi:hypothetical protein
MPKGVWTDHFSPGLPRGTSTKFEEMTPLRLQEGNHRGATDFAKFQRGHGLHKICVMGTRVLQNRVTNRVNFNKKTNMKII